ncbi:Y4yA family PLP-dependent enzyme [Ideonella sp. BN130291]|uniref:Y4yA family PLP-dependent enzyme n=1 Tax=Ideonella sp. BN130291 TaxID=3112940 RepID=UPI002E25B4E5|nr:Y4yA family PLP-dependent enzyme [Ideonella sp. BN130291]
MTPVHAAGRPAPAGLVLPALQHPLVQRLFDEHAALLHELVDGLGSPLHLMLPQVFAQNATAFAECLRTEGVDGLVLYAKKANKAHCLDEACARLGLGVDAASAQELTQALGAGVPGPRVGVSGPAKQPALMRLALRQGSLLAMDSLEELQACALAAAAEHGRARVLLRWRPDSQPRSRFGMADAELDAALDVCLHQQAHLGLEGFSFHLTGYSAAERAEAAHALVQRCLDARARGLQADCINIGGGFAVRYVEPAAWRDFQAQQGPAHYHAGKAFGGFYPYAAECHGAAMLAAVLAARPSAQEPLSARLRRHGVRLLLEPGRALLDQAGLTLFRVQGVKDRPDGYGVLTVEGTSFSMSEQWFDSEYLPDPLLLPDRGDAAMPYIACVAGTSCLDSDMVSWRKLRLPRRPVPGDLLAYLNTAGYQMDSNESPFHGLPLPRKVAVEFHAGQRLHWRLDSVAPLRPLQII